MFHKGIESMYHVTAEGQGLSWELKVAAQEHQKLFLQEIEEHLIAPLLPAASRRHTGHKRKGTASSQHAVPSTREKNSPISIPSAQHVVPSTKEENSPISVPSAQHAVPTSKHKRGKFTNICTTESKKNGYSGAVPSTREGNSPKPVLDLVPPGPVACKHNEENSP